NHQVGHVDRLADLRARGHGGLAVRRRTPPTDQVGVLAEAEPDQVVVGDLGKRRLVRRAHQRDAARAEEAGQPFTGDVVGHVCHDARHGPPGRPPGLTVTDTAWALLPLSPGGTHPRGPPWEGTPPRTPRDAVDPGRPGTYVP